MAYAGLDDTPAARRRARHTTPMAALVSGPTKAIQNSVLALAGFFSIWETPPMQTA